MLICCCEMFDCRKKNNVTENAIRNKKKLKDDMVVATKNRLLLFGRWVPEFHRLIDIAFEKKQLKKKPLGPIGSLIELREIKWALAIEVCLKKLLMAICVDNHSDRAIVQNILKTLIEPSALQPFILVAPFRDELYDISQTKAQSNYFTILDMLIVSTPIVTNFLIDQASIEHILLIEDIETAQHVMYDLSPKNAYKAYTIDGDVVLSRKNASFYSAKQKQSQFFRSSITDALKEIDEQISFYQAEINQNQSKLSELTTNLEKNQIEFERLKLKYNESNSSVFNLQTKIKSIPDEGIEDTSLELLETEKKRCQENIEMFETKMADINLICTNLANDLLSHENSYKEKLVDIKQSKNDWNLLKESYISEKKLLLSTESEISEFTNKTKNIECTMEDLKVQSKKNEAAIQALLKDVKIDEIKENAVVSDRPISVIQEEIRILHEAIANSEIKEHDLNSSRQNYEILVNRYQKLKNSIQTYNDIFHTLTNQINVRLQRAEIMQTVVIKRAKYFFNMLLSQRGYNGDLIFDDQQKKLFINVNINKAKGSKTDNRCMSGGEKSFSTLTFIMALWEVMDSPFRCLDEFDVFMDMVNRKMSLHLLIEYSRSNKSCQLILLTPQDLSMIKEYKDVSVYQLEDPERETN